MNKRAVLIAIIAVIVIISNFHCVYAQERNINQLIYILRNSPNEAAREEAAYFLGEDLGNNQPRATKDPRVIDALLYALENDKSSSVRQVAAYSLRGIKEERVVNAMIKVLETDKNIHVRLEVIYILGKIKEIERVRDILIETLEFDENAEVRRAAAHALGGSDDEEVISTLINILLDESEEKFVRAEAARSLPFGKIDKKRIDDLIDALNTEKEDVVKIALINALGKIEHKDRKVTNTLIHVLKKDKNPEVRKQAIWALEKAEDKEIVNALIDVLKKDKNEDVRMHAASALGTLKGTEITNALLEALKKDKSAVVKETAASALLKQKNEKITKELIKLLKEDIEIVKAVRFAFLIDTEKENIKILIKSLNSERDRKIREEITSILFWKLVGFADEEIIEFMIDVLKNEQDIQIKKSIVAILGNAQPPDEKTEEKIKNILIEFLKKEENELVRTEVVRSLAKRTKGDEKIAQLLMDEFFKSKGVIKIGIAEALSFVKLKKIAPKQKENFAFHVANLTNEDLSHNPHNSKRWASLINRLHDQDDERDLMRINIIKNLNTRSKYYLIALAGDQLYTSTFFIIYNELIKNENFFDEIKIIDPKQEHLTKFILTLSQFGVAKDLIKKDPNYFFPFIKQALEDKKNIIENVATLVSTFDFIFETKELGEIRTKFQDLLLELYNKYKEDKNFNGTRAIGYLIKINKNYFDIDKMEKVKIIDREIPEFLEPRVPEEWFRDGKITAKLYFYPDEYSFEDARNYYARQIGINRIDTTDSKITLTLRPLNKIKVKHVSKGKISVIDNIVTIQLIEEGKIDLEIDGESSLKEISFYSDGTTIIRKQIKNILTEIILTRNTIDVQESLNDPDIDIMAHRGHSYHLCETFPKVKADCKKKLLYLGSCGSFRHIPHLQKNYKNCYYIADQDIGRGWENNLVLDNLLFAIASGKREWKDIKLFIQEKVNASGIVYPSDPELFIYIITAP